MWAADDEAAVWICRIRGRLVLHFMHTEDFQCLLVQFKFLRFHLYLFLPAILGTLSPQETHSQTGSALPKVKTCHGSMIGTILEPTRVPTRCPDSSAKKLKKIICYAAADPVLVKLPAARRKGTHLLPRRHPGFCAQLAPCARFHSGQKPVCVRV